MSKGLGRIFSPDNRDNDFRLSAIVQRAPAGVVKKYWNANGWWGDQGDTPHCVGYAWAHWLEDGPITHKVKSPIVDPNEIYFEAQKRDAWDGENYDGTSVRAGAAYLKEKGFISGYRWTWSLQETIDTILTLGPVVVGTNWYERMFYPADNNIIAIGGSIAGGHAYLVNGVNVKLQLFRIKNNWGRLWGNKGHAYIKFQDMERLIGEDGEVCLALEVADVK